MARRIWNWLLALSYLAVFVVAWRVFHWNSAEVAAWVSGIGALAAAGAALKIAGDETKRHNDEKEQEYQDSLDRAVRRAQRVDVKVISYDRGDGHWDFDVHLVNWNTSPIYKVTYHCALVTFYRSAKKQEVYRGSYLYDRARDKAVALDVPESFVNTGGSRWQKQLRFPTRPLLLATDPPATAPVNVVVAVSFEDDDGNLFGLVADEVAPAAASGKPRLGCRWVLAYGDYPDNVSESPMCTMMAAATSDPIPAPKSK